MRIIYWMLFITIYAAITMCTIEGWAAIVTQVCDPNTGECQIIVIPDVDRS